MLGIQEVGDLTDASRALVSWTGFLNRSSSGGPGSDNPGQTLSAVETESLDRLSEASSQESMKGPQDWEVLKMPHGQRNKPPGHRHYHRHDYMQKASPCPISLSSHSWELEAARFFGQGISYTEHFWNVT